MIKKHVILRAMWDPNGTNIVSLSENSIQNYDLNSSSSPKLSSSANLEAKGQPKFTNCKWNTHHGSSSQIATTNDTAIRGWDLRTMKLV